MVMAWSGQTSAASSTASRRESSGSLSYSRCPSSLIRKTSGAEKTHCPWSWQTSMSTMTFMSLPPRGADAAEFPVTAQGGGDDLFGLGGLRPDVVPDRDGPGDDVVAQPSQAFGLDLDHVPRPHGTRVGGGARQQHVARVQGDRAGDVGDEVVHVPLHLVGAAVLDQLAVDVGPQVLAAEVPVGDEAGPKGAERVGALDPEHRA